MEAIQIRGKRALAAERINGDGHADLCIYALRHDEEDFTKPVEVARGVLVNRLGYLIAAEPLEMPDGGLVLTEEESEAIADALLPEVCLDAAAAALRDDTRDVVRFERWEFDLPAHWASAIINGDRTGLDDEEERQLDLWFERHAESLGDGHWSIAEDPADCRPVEASFRKYHDAYDVMPLACDTLVFVWMKRVGEEVAS